MPAQPDLPLQILWELNPQPEVANTYRVEIIDRNKPGYKELPPGTPHPNRDLFPGMRLMDTVPVDGSNILARQYWSNDYINQNVFNYNIGYSGESATHPIWARKYLVRRDLYQAIARGTTFTGVFLIRVDNPGSSYTEPPEVIIAGDGTGATAQALMTSDGTVGWIRILTEGTGYTTATVSFTGGGGIDAAATVLLQGAAKLVHQELQEMPDDEPRRSLMVWELRVYETLPGPEITGHEYNDRGELQTNTKQRVVTGTAADADGVNVISSEVNAQDTIVSQREVSTVPERVTLTSKEYDRPKAQGALVTIGDTIVVPGTVLPDPTYTSGILDASLKTHTVTKARRLITAFSEGNFHTPLLETHVDEQTGICVDWSVSIVPAATLGGIGNVATIALSAGGTSALTAGYYFLTFTGSSVSSAVAIATVNVSGVVTAVQLIYGGAGYATAPTAALAGSTATFTLSRANGYVEVNRIDKWRSTAVTSVLRDGSGTLATSLPPDTRYPMTQRESFPDVLKDIELQIVSPDGTGTSTGTAYNLIEGYSGPCAGRLTQKYMSNAEYVNWDSVAVGTIFTTRPAITQFFPQANRIAVQLGAFTLNTREYPMSLHAAYSFSLLGGTITATLPATKPTDLPYETWIVRSIKEEQWRFGIWLVQIIEIFVPPDPQVP